MKTLFEETIFNCSATDLWVVLSDVGRCDWVPTINKIILEDDYRYFEMDEIGQITEKILKIDNEKISRPFVLNKNIFLIKNNSIIKLN